MLLDIYHNGGEAAAEEYVMDKLQQRARIMGFGHRVYMRRYDPRALFLRDYIEALADRRPEGRELHAIYRTVEGVMLRERGLYPNADYPIALLFYLLDIPVPLDTPIFQCARIAGLVAHVIEQQEEEPALQAPACSTRGRAACTHRQAGSARAGGRLRPGMLARDNARIRTGLTVGVMNAGGNPLRGCRRGGSPALAATNYALTTPGVWPMIPSTSTNPQRR